MNYFIAPHDYPVSEKKLATLDTLTNSIIKKVELIFPIRLNKSTQLEDIAEVTCKFFGINIDDFKKKCNKPKHTTPRQFFMTFSKQNTGYSLREIGLSAGGKDHSTVVHARKVVGNLCETDTRYREKWIAYNAYVKNKLKMI